MSATTAAVPDAWQLPAQEHAAKVLYQAVSRGDVGHAWAFTGPRGVGQQDAARRLAAALNCVDPPSDGVPCGACSVCDRCRRGAFGAYYEFVPSGTEHRADDVRNTWLEAAYGSLMEGRWKVLRVVDADRMNVTAANALLKGLEEPPARTVWILDITDPEPLPDTIMSRCRDLAFARWSLADLERYAADCGVGDVTDARLAARLADGSPAALDRYAESGTLTRGSGKRKEETAWSGMAFLREHRAIPGRLRDQGQGFALRAAYAVDQHEIACRTAALKERHATELVKLDDDFAGEVPVRVRKLTEDRHKRAEREAKLATVRGTLDDLVSWYRDGLFIAAGGDPEHALHSDAVDQLRADADALGSAGMLRAIDLIWQTADDLDRNVQVRLALEALFLDLAVLTMRR